MNDKPKRTVTITVIDQTELYVIGTSIHKQLVGNEDYINSNIVLHLNEETLCVELFIFKEAKNVPEINLSGL